MYKLDIPLDRKEAAAIQRRKQLENERQSRIFNAKQRLIGIDKQGIDQQINDNKVMRETEKARNDAYMRDMVRNDNIAVLLEQREVKDVRQLNKCVNDFRVRYQQPETRREYDLYDPNSKKKDQPARISDDDPRCTLSSMQKFQGEDLSSKRREKMQQEQRREWAMQQLKEKQNAIQQQKEADRLYDLKRVEQDMRSLELEAAERATRRNIAISEKNFNLKQAQEKSMQDAKQKEQEEMDNYTEISNQAFGDFLTENPQTAISALGKHRVITDRWKGMSDAQLEEIRKTQEAQRQDKIRSKQEESQMSLEWDRQRMIETKAGTLMEQRQERLRRQLRKEQDDANKYLNQEQKAHQKFLDKEVYINPPTGQYFMQFNTTSR